MANTPGNPQLEDGYARIANEILEAISRTRLSDYESRCIHFLWRKTYGWQDRKGNSKKNDAISFSQWSEGTGVDRRNIIRSLDALVKRNIVTRVSISLPRRNITNLWAFNKLYLSWNGYEAKPVSAETPLQPELVSIETPLQSQPVSVETPLSYKPVSVDDKVVSVETLDLVSVETPTKDNKDNITKDILSPLAKKKKKTFGEFKNVLITDEEYKKLIKRYNSDLPAMIENLSGQIASKGYKYKSHYATLITWANNDAKEKFGQKKGAYGKNERHTEVHGERQATSDELQRSYERFNTGT